MNDNFLSLPTPYRNAVLSDDFPSELIGWNKDGFYYRGEDSLFGFVQESCLLTTPSLQVPLMPGMYFCVSDSCTVEGGSGFAVRRLKHRAFNLIGGPIEQEGRLKYIDGCTDSLLIPPVKLGDPCLNLLHFPKQIRQTMHTHPSNRIGIVTRGRGVCHTPTGEHALVPGMAFIIPKEGQHCFSTQEQTMDVIAWHPDSDFGPMDGDHPMINRTFVEGVSAAILPHLQTK